VKIPGRVWLAALCWVLPLWVQAAGVHVGDPAPPVSLPVLAGTDPASLDLATLRGRVVYVDFWASWCGPCRLSFPRLQALREELGPRGFEVVAINVDEFEEDARSFLEQMPVSYPVVRDDSGEIPAAFGVLGMPAGYLLDRDGVVRAVHQGFRRGDEERLRAEILPLLGQQP
jgi:thiol-disulfide isomerase/thioredoxin